MQKNSYSYKVFIPTSGIGQRLGDLTSYTNKSLVRIGKKPAISYIIESYPKEIPLVIALGHFGNHVKEFLELAYPDRKIELVSVDKFDGKGSSVGYSMLQAKEHLQCPFIYQASDTIVSEQIPTPLAKNWIGGSKGVDSSQYASWKALNNRAVAYNDFGAVDFDYIHIGLIGIKDYKKFWEALENNYEKDDNSKLNDGVAIETMLKAGVNFEVINFPTWLDTGNAAALNNAKKNIPDHFDNLDKFGESTFLFDNFVVKFFSDTEIIAHRVKRANYLSGLVPKLEGSTQNFYRYQFIPGDLYSRSVTATDFKIFLNWARTKLWKKVNETSNKEFKKVCYQFYHDKTIKRLQSFYKINNISDEENIINGEHIPSIGSILKKVDFKWLCEAEQFRIHGDLILDNILRTHDGFCLLDWRQDFGGLIRSGDIYYDLAKLNHNLVVNHDVINQGMFSMEINGHKINCDIMRKQKLVVCQDILSEFLKKNGYDVKKVRILTSLIWLNMSPLHHYPFNLFLYYFGKLNLWQSVNQQK